MDFEEVSYTLDNEHQFWDELEEIVSVHCQSHEHIDNVLRSFLSFTTNYKGEYIQSDYDVARCSYKLLESALFATHKDYVRRQIIYGLLQEDTADTLLIITSFLLLDGRQNEPTFEMINGEGGFPRLLELIQSTNEGDPGLHRMLLDLLYEMSRIQRLRIEDLIQVDDGFVQFLLQKIEGLSNDVDDPYHYPVVRVLLVLNEQYMVSAHDPGPGQVHITPVPNKVIDILSQYGSANKTFGENIILLLNRENETSLQLLILKLLYLLFTTRKTYEYFYTNDLRVLVDVMIRNLLDLPLASTALRHTYLRVLYPLLSHTQLKLPGCHYKREELVKLLQMMTSNSSVGLVHFGAIDETTKRLVGRCEKVQWLKEGEEEERNGNRLAIGGNLRAADSSLSVLEVAVHREKPGVQTPSRNQNGSMVKEARKTVNDAEKTSEEATKAVQEAEKLTEAEKGEKANGDGSIGNNVSILVDRTEGIGLAELKSPFEVEGEA